MSQIDITHINLEELEMVKDLMKDRFSDMVTAFLEDAKAYLFEIEQGIQQNDLEKVIHNAHPLKSSSASMGITGVSEVARTMEENARNDCPIQDIQELLPLLNEAFDFAESKLNSMM